MFSRWRSKGLTSLRGLFLLLSGWVLTLGLHRPSFQWDQQWQRISSDRLPPFHPNHYHAVSVNGASGDHGFIGIFPYALDKLSLASGSPLRLTNRTERTGKLGNAFIEFCCESYRPVTEPVSTDPSKANSSDTQFYSLLSLVRLVTFKGAGYDVFNLLAMPAVPSDGARPPLPLPLPILGLCRPIKS